MAGECHWALYWAKIIMRSVDAVSERQRCELQSHCHSRKRSELQPRCHGTACCRHSHEKVRSTEPDDRRKMSPTGTAGEWCATLVLQLTSSTEPTSSARALSRTAPYCASYNSDTNGRNSDKKGQASSRLYYKAAVRCNVHQRVALSTASDDGRTCWAHLHMLSTSAAHVCAC